MLKGESFKEWFNSSTVQQLNESFYSETEIDLMKSSVLRHDVKTNKLSLYIYGTYNTFELPFCPKRAHHNPVTFTRTCIGYHKDMIRLGLFVFCFKSSCENMWFMKDGDMEFKETFYTLSIKNQLEKYLSLMIQSDPKIFKFKATVEEETHIKKYHCMYVNTHNIRIQNYISGTYDVHQLYVFVNDLEGYIMMCITKSMNYIFIIMPPALSNLIDTQSNTVLSSQMDNCEVFVHPKDPYPFLTFLLDNNKISKMLHSKICSILNLEKMA